MWLAAGVMAVCIMRARELCLLMQCGGVQIWEARQREAARSAVVMYRSYRRGELPDIQIQHADMLTPLSALHTDPTMARHLFLVITTALYKHVARHG